MVKGYKKQQAVTCFEKSIESLSRIEGIPNELYGKCIISAPLSHPSPIQGNQKEQSTCCQVDGFLIELLLCVKPLFSCVLAFFLIGLSCCFVRALCYYRSNKKLTLFQNETK
jgi:hypothetical protein